MVAEHGSDTSRRFAVLDGRISADALRPLVVSPGAGAVCTFEGTVRDHTGARETSHLEYEAYGPMAERVFKRIAAVAESRWPIAAMAIHHRVGRLEIGDVSVAIAVASEHRDAAFEACRYAIDQLKSSAPVWKKEFGPGGSFWVEGPLPEVVSEGTGSDTSPPGGDSAS